ncbi:NAD(P)-dependent alcohol dehydrogenase [Salinactinospora qingdaonensis]|uniref:NAD(P)-dependent alcohol dehydrogenase n=1 Tax=Salinactinospora qingdaonensis TaxID=702744 RepID=A0ABP7G4C5_9ACTN
MDRPHESRAAPAGETAEVAEKTAPGGSDGRTTMRAVVHDTYGSADVLYLSEIEVPRPGEDEVVVQVEAAGVGRDVWHMMTGLPYLGRLAFGLRAPKDRVRGRDVAGRVTAVGAKVTRLRPGDAVMGVCEGSFAQYARAKESKLAYLPPGLTAVQAAAAPIAGCTALQALRERGGLRAGQRVLVIGASGGVGTFAVQLATAMGARVTGVCSAAKADLVRSLGVERVIDYAGEDIAAEGPVYDLIIDIAGQRRLSHLRRALNREGTLVIVGGEGGDRLTGGLGRQLGALVLSPLVRQRLRMLVASEHHAGLEALNEFLQAGTVTPAIDTTYPLERAAEAVRRLESEQARGKVVVTV